jgi:hypothetical protein
MCRKRRLVKAMSSSPGYGSIISSAKKNFEPRVMHGFVTVMARPVEADTGESAVRMHKIVRWPGRHHGFCRADRLSRGHPYVQITRAGARHARGQVLSVFVIIQA